MMRCLVKLKTEFNRLKLIKREQGVGMDESLARVKDCSAKTGRGHARK